MPEIRIFKVLVLISWFILIYFVVAEQNYFKVPVETGVLVLLIVCGLIFYVSYKNKQGRDK